MGFLDRLKKPSSDESAVRAMLEAQGATPGEADELVQTLGRRLKPHQMQVWLSDPRKAHPVPDPEFAKAFAEKGLVPVTMNWTPINAVAHGKAHLVLDEARRFVE